VIRAWTSLWSTQVVTISSPLAPEVAARRLDEGITAGRDRRRAARQDPGAFVIIGRVRGSEVRLGATPAAVWNSWNTFLTGEIRPLEAGCVLQGRLGVVRWVWVQTIAPVILSLLVAIVCLVVAIVRLVQGQPVAPLPVVALIAAGTGVVSTLVVAAWTRAGRKGDAFLRHWLQDTLSSASPGGGQLSGDGARGPRSGPRGR
jgi:hypothetical protein